MDSLAGNVQLLPLFCEYEGEYIKESEVSAIFDI
jgi:hypothetical protein